jgi:hypothetical protein
VEARAYDGSVLDGKRLLLLVRHAHHRQASVAQLVGAGPVEEEAALEGSPQSTVGERERRHGLADLTH